MSLVNALLQLCYQEDKRDLRVHLPSERVLSYAEEGGHIDARTCGHIRHLQQHLLDSGARLKHYRSLLVPPSLTAYDTQDAAVAYFEWPSGYDVRPSLLTLDAPALAVVQPQSWGPELTQIFTERAHDHPFKPNVITCGATTRQESTTITFQRFGMPRAGSSNNEGVPIALALLWAKNDWNVAAGPHLYLDWRLEHREGDNPNRWSLVPSFIFDEDVVSYSRRTRENSVTFDQYRKLTEPKKWDYIYQCLGSDPLPDGLFRRAAINAIERACGFFIHESHLREVRLPPKLGSYTGSDETEGVRFFPRLYAYELSPDEKEALPRTGVRFRPWTPQEYLADASPQTLNGFLRWSWNTDRNEALGQLFYEIGLLRDSYG